MLRGDLDRDDLERYVEERVTHHHGRQGGRLGTGQLDLPAHLRARLLRDRDDHGRRRPGGHRAFRLGGVPGLAAPGRPDHPVGPRVDQDGAGHPPHLRPDARAQVGDLDGRVLLLDGRVQQLRARAGGQVHADRRSTSPAARRGPRRCCTESCRLRDKIQGNAPEGWRERYDAVGTEELLPGRPPPAPRPSTYFRPGDTAGA